MSGSPEHELHRLRNGIIWTAVLLVLLLGLGLAVPSLREVVTRITKANLLWLLLGVALEVLSCVGYVATVRVVLRRGPAREVRWLAWAEMAFGALVPVGGAGGLAVGAWAMRAWGLSWSRIANRSAVIFLLTSAVNAGVLALAGIAVAAGVGGGGKPVGYGLLPAAAAVVAILLFALVPILTKRFPGAPDAGRVRRLLEGMGAWVRDTEATALDRDWRLLGSIGYLLFDIAVLWACLRAVGISPPLMALVVAYQIGYLANVVPIPGGVGVLEGGLLGALLLYGFPAGPTAAAVVLYHAIALWVPSIGGTIGFLRLRKAVGARVAGGGAQGAETAAASGTRARDLAA